MADPLAAFGRSLTPALADLARLHLRFERARRLRAPTATAAVLVLASWSPAAVREGAVQAMAVLPPAAASALKRACAARGLRFVDNA